MKSPAVADGGYNNDRARRNYRAPIARSHNSPPPGCRARRLADRASQRIVTCRFASPARAERSASVSGEVSSRAPPGSAVATASHRLLERLGAGADRQVPDRHEQPVGPEHPDQPRRRRPARSSPAACSRASASSSRVLVVAAAPSAGAPWCRRRSSTPPRPTVRRAVGATAALACSSDAARRSRRVVDVGDPEVEAVVHLDRQRLVGEQVLQPRALARVPRSGRPSRPARRRGRRAARRPAPGSGRRSACCTWSPSQTVPSCRTRAGAAIGSSVHSSTSRSLAHGVARARSGAVAAGTISRIATRSHSAAGPRRAADETVAAPRRCRGRPCTDGPTRTVTGLDARSPSHGADGWPHAAPGLVASACPWRRVPTPRSGREPQRVSRSGMRTCTVVVAPRSSSTHQRSTSASTMLSPRPETAAWPASTMCGLVDPLPPSLTEITRSSFSSAQRDHEVVDRQRGGVTHAVADELGDDDAGVVDGLAVEALLGQPLAELAAHDGGRRRLERHPQVHRVRLCLHRAPPTLSPPSSYSSDTDCFPGDPARNVHRPRGARVRPARTGSVRVGR